MDRERFLREEHARIVASGEFMASEWRDSVDRFVADLWDMTDFQKAGRYLAPKDKSLGFSRDNVEYHFKGPLKRVSSAKPFKTTARKAKVEKAKPQIPTASERRAAEAAARLERRRKLAEQVLAWERRARGSTKSR